MELITRRFVLRDFREEDVRAFRSYRADARFVGCCEAEEVQPYRADQLLELFKRWTAEQPRRNYQFAIVHRQGSPRLVGCCGLRTASSVVGTAELGIELAPEFWGRYACAIEVLRVLIDFGFGNLGLSEIYGRTTSANVRITRIASAFGATATAPLAPEWMAGRDGSDIKWHVTREQWESGCFTIHSIRRAHTRYRAQGVGHIATRCMPDF